MLVDYVQRELADGSRTVVETEHEVSRSALLGCLAVRNSLLPKAHVLRITRSTDAQHSDWRWC